MNDYYLHVSNTTRNILPSVSSSTLPIILFHKSKWQIPFCLLLFNIMMDVVLMWWLYEYKLWSVETSFCVVTGHFVNK